MGSQDRQTDHHRRLLELEGDWDIQCRYYIDPNDEPIVVEGRETVEAFGDFWVVGSFQCVLGGTEIRGRSTKGYDPARDLFVETWQDTSTPYLYQFTGKFDDSGMVLETSGENVDPTSNQVSLYRSLETFSDPSRRNLELTVRPPHGGSDIPILFYDFTRRS